MITSVCQSRIKIQRETSLLLDSVSVSASMTLDRSPNRSTLLLVNFDSEVSGDITISGSLSGSSVSETLTISSSTFKTSLKKYDAVTSVDFDSSIVSSSSNVSIKSIGTGGIEQAVLTTVIASYPAQFVRQRPSSSAFSVNISGGVERNMPHVVVPFTTTFTPRVSDLITNNYTSEVFFVSGDPFIEHYGLMKHWVIKLQRKEE